MSKYIDVDKFCEKTEKWINSAYDDEPITRMAIRTALKWMKDCAYGSENAYGEKIPPVPYAIEVVRCKDCKYNYLDTNNEKKCLKVDRKPDFFCADGERKETK